MPKAKAHSGATKRFKKTGAGYKHKHANRSHILTKMSQKRKRNLRGTSIMNDSDAPLIDRLLRS
ncbi:MAG: 50S ribosomal protein L35 [Porticoccus sp.]|nr:50S ribosomal protein L35 [Porticoccus sp.]|tara:strand:+ start:37416 stop:37607 length:192 start_codon:yes stop_codon:yes gene_type:complete